MSNIKLTAEEGVKPKFITKVVTFEDICKANELISTSNIKGKDYAEVNQRVKAFRSVYPMGSIETEIVSINNGVVTMKATVKDEDGVVLATGLAQEKEGSSFINKTSFIENCETSAVGRALGFCGFGIETSICSAEELQNAIKNQGSNSKATETKYDQILLKYCKDNNIDPTEVAKTYKLNAKSTNEEYKKAYDLLKEAGESKAKNTKDKEA